MVNVAPLTRPRLVGQPLLYAVSVFASLGVFLVRPFISCTPDRSDPSPAVRL